MQYLRYQLQNARHINRFLISETHEEPVSGKPVRINEEANVWEGSVGAVTHKNPVREAFVAKRRSAHDPYPTFTSK